jgi:hypothetical protein
VVVLLAILSVAWAADADTEAVSQDFASAPGMTTARVVQNVKVFLNPDNVVKAKIVAHLPSHEADEQVLGNAFETSNFEANEVIAEDAESLESTELVETAEAETPSVAASAPIRQLKAQLVRASAMTSVPDMLLNPVGTPSDANAPVVPLGSSVAPAPPQVMDEAAVRASHLYIGHEPAGLPTGLEIKRPVDLSGTVGTEAGTNFDYSKKMKKGAKCGNGCQLKVPVMVGYVGIKEQPASGTREVRMPGDRQRWRNIHNDLKTTDKITWRQEHLNAARRHLKRSTRKIDNLRRSRKLYEDTALNREVVVPIRA